MNHPSDGGDKYSTTSATTEGTTAFDEVSKYRSPWHEIKIGGRFVMICCLAAAIGQSFMFGFELSLLNTSLKTISVDLWPCSNEQMQSSISDTCIELYEQQSTLGKFDLAACNPTKPEDQCTFSDKEGKTVTCVAPVPGDCDSSRKKNSFISASALIGALLGALSSSKLLKWGRRRTNFIVSGIFVIGSLQSAVADSYYGLLFARFVVGVGVGVSSVLAPTYIAEMSPVAEKGFYGIFHQVAITFGQVVAVCLGFAFPQVEYKSISLASAKVLSIHGHVDSNGKIVGNVGKVAAEGIRRLAQVDVTDAVEPVTADAIKSVVTELIDPAVKAAGEAVKAVVPDIPRGEWEFLVQLPFWASWYWRGLLLSAIIPIIISAILFMKVRVETPRYYFESERLGDAEEALRRVYGRVNVSEEMIAMGQQEQHKRQIENEGMSLWKAFTIPKYRNVIIIGLITSASQQFSGINVFMMASNQLYQQAGASLRVITILSAVMTVVNCLMTFPTILLIDRLGRRTLLLIGSIGQCIGLIPPAVMFIAFPDHSYTPWVAVGGSYIFILSFAVALGPVLWVWMTEIFPTEISGVATNLFAGANWASAFIMVTISTMFKNNSIVFPVMAGLNVLILAFLFTYVKETKGYPVGTSPYFKNK